MNRVNLLHLTTSTQSALLHKIVFLPFVPDTELPAPRTWVLVVNSDGIDVLASLSRGRALVIFLAMNVKAALNTRIESVNTLITTDVLSHNSP